MSRNEQQDLANVVEQLVDSISSLILAAVTGTLADVKQHCESIAKQTERAVHLSSEAALNSNDPDIQIEVTRAINGIATTIERLVAAFYAFVPNLRDAAQQKNFAEAAKNVGEAINELMLACDTTHQKRILSAIEDAWDSCRALHQCAKQSRDVYQRASQICADKNIQLIKFVNQAAATTLDKSRAQALADCVAAVREHSTAFIATARNVNADASFANTTQMDAALDQLNTDFQRLRVEAKVSSSYVKKVYEAAEYVNKLIEIAQNMGDAARRLMLAAGGSPEEFMAAAQNAIATAQSLIKQAEFVASQTADPVRRRQIEETIEEIRAATQALVQAARDVQANPNDPAARKRLEDAHKTLADSVSKIIALTNPNADPTTRYHYTTKHIEGVAEKMVAAARAGDAAALVKHAHELAESALQVVKDAEAVAATKSDPAERKRILDTANELKQLTQELISAARAVAQNPSDPAALARLADVQRRFLDKLNECRTAAGLQPSASASAPPPPPPRDDTNGAGNELLAAAREEADAARQLAAEAAKLLSGITDPAKRRQLQEEIDRVRALAEKVSKAAEYAAAHPNDPAAQQALADAQRELGEAIQRIVRLTSGAADANLDAAFRGIEDKSRDIFTAAQKTLDDLEKFFLSGMKLGPAEAIGAAKAISERANEMARLLREFAATVDDPVLKESLINFSKIVRDRALQLKIIAAVKVASGDSGDSDQVTAAARGVGSEIKDVMGALRAAMIKQRVKNTQGQIRAIHDVIRRWQTRGF